MIGTVNGLALLTQIGLSCLPSRTRPHRNAVWLRRCQEICTATYLATPLLPLLGRHIAVQNTATFALLLIKNLASMLAFPLACTLVAELSPSGRQGTVQGLATAAAHLARSGAYVGLACLADVGMKRELGLLPWWVLSISALGACLPLCLLA